MTARAKNVPNLSMVEPIAPAVRESDKRMRPPPCVPDTVSFDFAIPIYSLVPEMRLLRFFCGLTTTATLDDSASLQVYDAQYRWEGDSGKGICRAGDIGSRHLDSPVFSRIPEAVWGDDLRFTASYCHDPTTTAIC